MTHSFDAKADDLVTNLMQLAREQTEAIVLPLLDRIAALEDRVAGLESREIKGPTNSE